MPASESDLAKTEALAEIKERIRARVVEAEAKARAASERIPDPPDAGALRQLSSELKALCAQIGSMPPAPPTFRGRLGSHFVRLIQRALFWYTPQIRLSSDGIVRLFQQYIDSDRQEKELFRKQLADLAAKIAGLEAKIKALEASRRASHT